ncbi:MAG TPA: 2-oxoglutarate dehydrogenase complex dihydrolipoyllysine-residue succinyltransferase [Candidatus Eisenbacteria bacterium]|nr:2-oxoglutarate dehydrogenase complex dihydrolipoyllysine-residue succinyltransferase [Candidatus Eisenbacteria bacterium]
MAVELRVPEVGESITEVQIGTWLKKEGDSIERDEALVEIESDKATLELPAPVAGTLAQVLKKKGETVKVGDLIATIGEGEGKPGAKQAPASKAAAPAQAAAPAPAASKDAEAPAKPAAQAPRPAPAPATPSPAPARPSAPPPSAAPPRVMPSARRVAEQNAIDASQVAGTGPGGRVLKEDVMEHLTRKPAPAAPKPAAREAGAPAPPWTPPETDERIEEAVPMSPMRLRIAERLKDAQNTAALLTTFNEIDMSGVIAAREELRDSFAERFGVKLGFMSFFVKAAVDALMHFPQVNAEIRGKEVVYRNYYDLGIAVGGGKGLVVPVLRSAEKLSFAEIELRIADFGARAKENKLTLDELKGGTFTISNGGVYGNLLSTPIINPPQSGILGLHAIQKRPVVVDDQIVIRSMMYVALTYDHRIVDGREAVTFLRHVKGLIERPTRMLLGI